MVEQSKGVLTNLGDLFYRFIVEWGDVTEFMGRAMLWMVTKRPSKGTLIPIFYQIGVRSVSVVGITGLFIGMANVVLVGDKDFNLVREANRS